EGRRACYEPTGEREKLKDYSNNEQEYDVWRCDFAADGYRFPTEAEWEYASRAGSSGSFCFGSDEDLLPQYDWFVVNAKSRAWPGGARLPNAVGLFDMHGNVCEWCWDWLGDYPAEPASDPTGANGGSARVIRGGSFRLDADWGHSTYRSRLQPMYSSTENGFRVCCGR
ncbi:MAG TPA: SUMF1/EgtB/PvdO family nonheme iron enzyme, partial [Pirellulales bacterium]|nr:SUMF1/EgtB/PvdO family nonheme iron enzyme [Pirellulales bacterium]